MNCNSNNNEKNNVKNFGYLNDGRISTVITLKNSQGTEISVSNFGATITSIKTADRDGVFKNIVIGYSNVTPYEKGTPYFGATVGRFANRIAKGKFKIDDLTAWKFELPNYAVRFPQEASQAKNVAKSPYLYNESMASLVACLGNFLC